MRILPDDSHLTRPIGTAWAYARTAMSANWGNTLLAALILGLLIFFSFVPLLGLIFSALQAILLYALGYWVVGVAATSDSLDTFRQKAAATPFKALIFGSVAPASGFYVAIALITALIVIVPVLLFWTTGGKAFFVEVSAANGAVAQEAAAQVAQNLSFSLVPLLLMVVFSAFLSYLWPLVYGYALTRRTFTEAFKAAFFLFSPRFWRASFNGAYFRLVTLWMLAVFGLVLLLGITFAVVFLIPLALLLIILVGYFTAVVSAQSYNMIEEI